MKLRNNGVVALACAVLAACSDPVGPDLTTPPSESPFSAAVTASPSLTRDGLTFDLAYSATNKGNEALLDYVDARVTVPGLRIIADVCAYLTVRSRGSSLYRSGRNCVTYGPGIGAKTKTWRLYKSPSSSKRLRLLRSNNNITIDFSYVYSGKLDLGCASTKGACGAARVSTILR